MLASTDLHFAFGSRTAVRGVSLAVEPGRRVAVIGPNGSGKSTLLRLLGGHLAPSAGRVTLASVDVRSMRPAARARHLAFVPQAPSLALPFSVARFVAFGRHALGTKGLDAAVTESLEMVDLRDRAGDPLGELSQGQQQRASIARALCQLSGMPTGDRVLIADEPTASLDPAHDLLVRDRFADLARSGVGVVSSLHDLAAAAAFDRVLLLGPGGEPVVCGSPAQAVAEEPLERAFGARFRTHTDESGAVVAVSASRAR